MQFLPRQIKIEKPSKNIIVVIEDKEYQLCDYYSKKMWVNNKATKKELQSYNSGILNTKKDKYKTERIGRLGEMSLAKIINKPVNFDYVENGDSEDFIVNGLRVEIKTASHNYGRILIRRKTSTGRIVPINFDVIVGAYLIKENKLENEAIICLVGYEYVENIINLPLKNAIHGKHKNIEIGYNFLKPFFGKNKK